MERKETWITFLVVLVCMIVVGFLLYATAPQKSKTDTILINVSAGDGPVLGNSDAPVTIIEFSDYQCPFCKSFYEQTLPKIITEYIDTGKAKLVFRDFPSSLHPFAELASEGARCVREQGGDKAYYQMHNALFQSQSQLSAATIEQDAQSIGYNIDSCLKNRTYATPVENSLEAGVGVNVKGTPTFFINGVMIEGSQSYATFKAAIDDALAHTTRS